MKLKIAACRVKDTIADKRAQKLFYETLNECEKASRNGQMRVKLYDVHGSSFKWLYENGSEQLINKLRELLEKEDIKLIEVEEQFTGPIYFASFDEACIDGLSLELDSSLDESEKAELEKEEQL